MISVGDQVRSFDFERRDIEGERACYVLGMVECVTDPQLHPYFKDCARYAIRIQKRVFAGKEVSGADSNVGELVFPPVNGTSTWLGTTTNSVEKVNA